MNPTAIDIRDMLEASSELDLTFATDLFVGREPSSPANCVTIFDTPSGIPSRTYEGLIYYYPSVQIRVRNTSYEDAFELAIDIMDYLHTIHNQVWNGMRYTVIYCTGDPSLLDWDENNRARVITNFEIQKREEEQS